MTSTDPKPPEDAQQESCEKETSHMLEEARMVLPGVQALFGFQLIAVYNQQFAKLLDVGEQTLHVVSLVLTAMTIALLMTPAAYHRQAEPHQVTRRFLRMSSFMMTCGMFVLMLAIQIDCYLIANVILKSSWQSGLVVGFLGTLYFGLWFVLPRVMRRKKGAGQSKITVARS